MENMSIKVLLINKEYNYLDYMSRHLRKFECIPYEAVNGEEALELSINNNFDVAVIDNNLPYMEVCDVFNELKKLQPHVQAIFLFDKEKIADSVLESCSSSPFDYLMKPFDFMSLVQKIVAAYELRVEVLASFSEHTHVQGHSRSGVSGFFQKLRKWYSLPNVE